MTIDEKKIVFCTIYRIGNLGESNHASIISTIKTFYKVRNPRMIFVIGDINLSSVTRPLSKDGDVIHGIDNLFTDSFDDLGLDQLVNEPTHLKGKTLDLLLITSKDSISDVKVSLNEGLCKSDHFLLNFEV